MFDVSATYASVFQQSSANKSKKRAPAGGDSDQPQPKKARPSEAEDSGEEDGVQEIGDDEAEDE